MAAALLWLLAAGTLLVSAGANEAYDLLHETYKKGVDLTLEQLNSHVGINHHFLFFKSLSKSDIQVGDVRVTQSTNGSMTHHKCYRYTVQPCGYAGGLMCNVRLYYGYYHIDFIWTNTCFSTSVARV